MASRICLSSPALRRNNQSARQNLGAEKVQKHARAHDANARSSLRSSRSESPATTNPARLSIAAAMLLVVVPVSARGLDFAFPSDEERQDHDVFEPEFWVKSWPNVLADLWITEGS